MIHRLVGYAGARLAGNSWLSFGVIYIILPRQSPFIGVWRWAQLNIQVGSGNCSIFFANEPLPHKGDAKHQACEEEGRHDGAAVAKHQDNCEIQRYPKQTIDSGPCPIWDKRALQGPYHGKIHTNSELEDEKGQKSKLRIICDNRHRVRHGGKQEQGLPNRHARVADGEDLEESAAYHTRHHEASEHCAIGRLREAFLGNRWRPLKDEDEHGSFIHGAYNATTQYASVGKDGTHSCP
mmetsp:Transcript_31875/g.74526  ORF Transcript_31875/g.74526 Transcript_31875/m.74526 type:complete len:237 (+) Transcript_31875:3-713(+)